MLEVSQPVPNINDKKEGHNKVVCDMQRLCLGPGTQTRKV